MWSYVSSLEIVSAGAPNRFFGRCHLNSLRRDPLGHVIELRRRYGDEASYRIGPFRIYQFSHPDHVNEILVKKAPAFTKSMGIRYYFQRWLGEGLFLSEGERWRRQRRKVRGALQQFNAGQRAANVSEQVRALFANCQDKEVDMAACMDQLAFSLNLRNLLGADANEACPLAPTHAPVWAGTPDSNNACW